MAENWEQEACQTNPKGAARADLEANVRINEQRRSHFSQGTDKKTSYPE